MADRGFPSHGGGRGGNDRGRGRPGFDRGHPGYDRGHPGYDRGHPGYDRGRGFNEGFRGDPRMAYGPPSANRGRGGPRYSEGGFEGYHGYGGPGPMPGFEGGMAPPLLPPPGRGRGAPFRGNSQPPLSGRGQEPRRPSGPSQQTRGSRTSSAGRSEPELKPQQQKPTERGDTISNASSTENLPEAARQKKSHPIVRQGADLASALSKLQIQRSMRIPSRPDDGGTCGRRVDVIVNCWDISVKAKTVLMYFVETIAVYRLDKEKGEKVEVRMPPKEKRALIQQIVDALPGEVIYDGGHTVYSEDTLPGISKEGVQKTIEIKDPLNRDQLLLEYRIMEVQTVSTEDVANYTANEHATSLDMPQDSIRLLDCLLKTVCKGAFVALGRNALYYDRPENVNASKLFSIHKGFLTSVRPQWKVRVNIDMSCKAFFTSGNLADVMYNKYGDDMLRFANQMAYDLKKIRVETIPFYNTEKGEKYSRRFTVHGISSESARTLMISDINQSVEKYFLEHHKIALKYPELPCVKVSLSRDVFMPMELLNVLPYQTPNARKADIASEVIRSAAVRPNMRFEELKRFVNRVLQSSHPLVSRFGLKINNQPVTASARVLDTPVANFGHQVDTLKRGAWIPPSFFSPAGNSQPIQWAIISVPGHPNANRHQGMLAQELPKIASRFNMKMKRPELAIAARASLGEHFQKFQAKGVKMVLLVLYDDQHYPSIKRLGDIQTGMRTQCVRGQTLEKRGVLQNLLYKINGKLGGVNWQLKNMTQEDELIMVFGADVTHPAPTQTQHVRQSIAAVTGSVTRDLMRYAVVVRQQATTEKGSKTTREIIDAMESVVTELLTAFGRNNNERLPNRLIFYRDGVSEGQFENVLVEELASIQRACSALRPGYEPAITYIVVQKRHHLRFMPLNGQRNVEPGTVVDTEVTHPREFDFYLCSQDGIQGTSKPAHYHVLYDDSDWSSDALQQFTYFLCHAYMRCPRSVSLPAPTYYAHLAAFRARDWISDLNEPTSILKDGKFCVHSSQITGMYYL